MSKQKLPVGHMTTKMTSEEIADLLNKLLLKSKTSKQKPSFPEIQLKHYHLINIDEMQLLPATSVTPSAKSLFTGYYTPAQLKQIYNVPKVLPKQSVRPVSITIVIAYTYPNLQNDFNLFCSSYGLPQSKLNIVTMPDAKQDSGWAQEECLDVQWCYAMNPNATIRVVEAKSAGFSDMVNALTYANNSKNGITDIISMSWGSNEFGRQQINLDKQCFTNSSICYLAASGDTNSVSWPSTCPNVISCGGTTLNSNSNVTARDNETTWIYAGCGLSVVYDKPNYQFSLPTISKYTKRCIPDISAVANQSTGVSVVYNGKYYTFGGTSVSTPVLAGVLSLGVQQRLNSGKSSITSVQTSSTQSNLLQNLLYKTIYSNPNSYRNNFYDVTKGIDGKDPSGKYYIAGSKHDIPTGLGVPLGNGFVTSVSQF
jgi:subtilase family serine protease